MKRCSLFHHSVLDHNAAAVNCSFNSRNSTNYLDSTVNLVDCIGSFDHNLNSYCINRIVDSLSYIDHTKAIITLVKHKHRCLHVTTYHLSLGL